MSKDKDREEFFLRNFNPEFVERAEMEMVNWNTKFPLDLFWRRKFNVPFGSKQHREITAIEQLHDYLEERMLKIADKAEARENEVIEYDEQGNAEVKVDERVEVATESDIDARWDELDEEIREDE